MESSYWILDKAKKKPVRVFTSPAGFMRMTQIVNAVNTGTEGTILSIEPSGNSTDGRTQYFIATIEYRDNQYRFGIHYHPEGDLPGKNDFFNAVCLGARQDGGVDRYKINIIGRLGTFLIRNHSIVRPNNR